MTEAADKGSNSRVIVIGAGESNRLGDWMSPPNGRRQAPRAS
jgi:hypothetical protein